MDPISTYVTTAKIKTKPAADVRNAHRVSVEWGGTSFLVREKTWPHDWIPATFLNGGGYIWQCWTSWSPYYKNGIESTVRFTASGGVPHRNSIFAVYLGPPAVLVTTWDAEPFVQGHVVQHLEYKFSMRYLKFPFTSTRGRRKMSLDLNLKTDYEDLKRELRQLRPKPSISLSFRAWLSVHQHTYLRSRKVWLAENPLEIPKGKRPKHIKYRSWFLLKIQAKNALTLAYKAYRQEFYATHLKAYKAYRMGIQAANKAARLAWRAEAKKRLKNHYRRLSAQQRQALKSKPSVNTVFGFDPFLHPVHKYKFMSLQVVNSHEDGLFRKVEYGPVDNRPNMGNRHTISRTSGPSVTEEALRNKAVFLSSIHGDIEKQVDVSGIAEEWDQKVIRKLYDKIGKQQVHLGNIIAERAQTLELLKDAHKRLFNFFTRKALWGKRTARKAWTEAIRYYFSNPKTPASDLLAFKFGVEPLIADINGLINLLRGLDEDGRKQEFYDKPWVSIRANMGGKAFRRNVNFSTEVFSFSGQMELSYALYYKIDSEVSHELQALGLSSPAELAWEAGFLSFVVDWLIPVGAFLQALNSEQGLSYLKGTRKLRLTGTFKFFDVAHAREVAPTDSTSLSECELVGTWINREVLHVPPDKLKILGLKDPLTFWHAAEGAALITQVIPNKFFAKFRRRR